MNVVAMLVGMVLLLFGRRLFWFFVAAAGFAAGLMLARDSLQLESDALVLGIALVAGVLGALLSFLLQKIAIGVAGFAAGGYLGATLLRGLNAAEFAWIGWIVGGILGALLLLTVFEWALIVISSLLGAALLADAFANRSWSLALFAAALVLGLLVQAMQLKRTRQIDRPPAGGKQTSS